MSDCASCSPSPLLPATPLDGASPSLRRRSLVLAPGFAFASSMLGAGLARAAPGDEGGPRQLLITYRSLPAQRPAFRAYLSGEGLAPWERLLREGVLTDYQVFFNPYVSSYTWDAMVAMTFRSFADTARWAAIERSAPGGLSAQGLRLAQPMETYAADLEWQGGAAPDEQGVYYVIPYEYRSAQEYRAYVRDYVLPQVEGWMREGVLAGYRIYMNRYPVGRPWDSLFVYQYRDLASFGKRDEVVAKVRGTLKDNPVWQKLNETKQNIRSESENAVAQLLHAGRAG